MYLSFLQNDFVRALCWTLIHSLWQGLLLAVVTGIVMIATRRSAAGKRYRLLSALFFLFMAVTVVTFIKELNKEKISAGAGFSAVQPEVNYPLPVTGVVTDTKTSVALTESFTDRFKEYFDTHAYLVVAIWFILFIAKFIKLVGSLMYVQRLKHYRSYEVADEWKEKLRQLISSLGIRKKIKLLESGIVQVPLVMGIFKPVILLPAGLLTNLPADEIEAILLHELAHIQRKDYFVNLLQSFAETIFFFNPALMWLSSMIRDERENCCDDIAISVTNSKTKFINALIAFQEYNFSSSSYSVGFTGKKNQLLNRVKRIVHEKNKTLNATEKSILTFGIAIFIMFSFVAAKKIPVTELNQAIVQSLGDKQPAEKNAADQKATAFFSSAKHIPAETVSSVMLPAFDHNMQMMQDTVPSKMQVTRDTLSSKHLSRTSSHTSVYGPDSTEEMFPHMSIHSNDDGHERVLTIEATKKDGHQYKLMKVNDVVTEFSIDNTAVPSANFSAHSAEISDMETAYNRRREKSVWQRLRADSARRMNSFNKERAMARRQDENLKRQLANIERDRMMANGKRNGNYRKDTAFMDGKLNSRFRKDSAFRKERILIDTKRDLILKDGLRKRVLKDGILDGDYRKDTALRKERILIDRIRRDTVARKAGRDTIHMKELLRRNGEAQLNKQLRLIERSKENYRKDTALQSQRIALVLRKEDAIRERRAEDDINIRSSVEQIKNIIADLQKENIKVDEKTSWFGLDNNQFVVDGKPMSKELHEKFKAKYIRPNGLGYYYGPVQITGRGVFLDYYSVHAK